MNRSRPSPCWWKWSWGVGFGLRRVVAFFGTGGLALFAVFTCVNTAALVHGAQYCECFGVVAVRPWMSLAIDVACLLLLVATVGAVRRETQAASSSCTPLWKVGAAACCVLLGYATLTWTLDHSPLAAQWRGEAVRFVEPSLILGDISGGQMHTLHVQIVNKWDRPVTLIGGSNTCACHTTADLPVTIAPREVCSVSVQTAIGPQQGAFAVPVRFYTNVPWQPFLDGEISGRAIQMSADRTAISVPQH